MEGSIDASTLARGRTLVAGILLLGVLLVRGRGRLRRPDRSNWGWLLLLGGFLGLVQVSYFAAIARIQVAAAILLEYLAPALVVVFAWLFQGRRATRTTLAALAAALAGCALVVQAYDPDVLTGSVAGVAFGLLAAVTFAGYILTGEHLQTRIGVVERMMVAFLVAFVVLALLPPYGPAPDTFTPRALIGIFLVGSLGTLAPYVLFMASFRYLDAGRATITSTVEPVVAGLIAYPWFGESFTGPQLAGAALVIGAVVLLQREQDLGAGEAVPESLAGGEPRPAKPAPLGRPARGE